MGRYFSSRKVQKILRWIAVLPVSIIGSCIAYSVFYFLNYYAAAYFFAFDTGGGVFLLFFRLYNLFLSSFVSGFAFIHLACYIAPNFKRAVAIVLTALFVILTIVFCGIWLFVTHEYYNLAAGLGGLFGVLPAMCFYINEYSYVKKAKEQAKKAIADLGDWPDPNRDPLLQLVELLLFDENGNLDPPYQVDLSDLEWEYFLEIEDVEKVLRKLIKSEHMELPKDHEQMRVWATELVGLALEE
ncbi:MAG: hypothetical protein KAV87_33500 [Desulfobacteraceae bacterium]|nr:hypothetical protein [Desulfobacteraceae bacterium]